MIKTTVIENFYQDSVKLMLLSRELKKIDGVEEVAAIMATQNNLDILRGAGILTDEAQAARPDDIAVVVKAKNSQVCQEVLEQACSVIAGKTQNNGEYDADAEPSPKSIKSAAQHLQGANLVLISVPGKHAFPLADQALDLGLNPMIFSDNMSIEEEQRLKEKANEKGLIVMGPDCGTAILDDKCIGFGNKVKRGSIGVVGASGTGIQEFVSLIHNNGGGISQAIGTGGRDLHKEIGGLSMLKAMDILNEDADTELIVLLSKPADAAVAAKVQKKAHSMKKPVIICFIGNGKSKAQEGQVTFTDTLEDAAITALKLAGSSAERPMYSPVEYQGYIRGLYTGGTLAYEALYLLKGKVEELYSNVTMDGILPMNNPMRGEKNSIVDLGDDQFTRGRAHPMIDPEWRNSLIVQEALDPNVGVLLLDFVLGYGCNEDPVGAAADNIKRAIAGAGKMGKELKILAHVCGTNLDPQQLHRQEARLKELGVTVYPSNASMIRAIAGV